ncbi:Ig-like domain-containing protein [Pantoea sp. A4]|uniref:Ig-like domain-containing protein n=1 Tax=Pantoea sp. A4 TaxID=1225184 RepID=UPI002357CC08|nr:Ig-like domain-containing protein [Pantoea sp. A4]
MSGTAEAGSTVSVYDGTELLGTVTVGTDGSWSFTTPSLGDGDHSLTTTVTDAAGNVSPASDPISFTVDTVAPEAATDLQLANDSGSLVVPIAAGGDTNDSTPVLSGTAEAGSTVSVYDGTALLGTATVGQNGNWSFTVPALNDGAHSLTTTVTDAAGNVSPASEAIVFTVDTVAPESVSGVTVTDNVGDSQGQLTSGATTDDNTPTFAGQAEAGAVVKVYDGGTLLGSTSVDTDGSWSFTPNALSNGVHSFTTTVTDAAGNVSDASPTFNLTIAGSVPPTSSSLVVTDDTGSTLVELANGASTHDNTPTLSGFAGANDAITLYNGDVVIGNTTADANGQWVFDTSLLPDGTYAFHATATNAVGNSSDSVTITITIDTVDPAAAGDQTLVNDNGTTPVVIADGSATNDNTPTLSGTAEAGSVVTVSDNGNVIGSTTAGDDGSWSFTTPTLSDGDHSLTTTVTDAAGNSSPASAPIGFTVDTVAPEAVSGVTVTDNVGDSQGELASGATTDDNTPTFAGQAEAGAVVSVYDGDTLLGSVTAGQDGSWSFTPDALTNGAHSFTTTVTDAAGNVSAISPAFDLTIDAGAPPVTTTLVVTDDTGATLVELADGAFTHDSTPTLSGLASASALITLYNGNTVIGFATADTEGKWVFDTSALPDGSYAFHAVATDSVGNNTDSVTINITIDTVAPDATSGVTVTDNVGDSQGELASGATTDDNTPTFAGQAEAGGVVKVYDGDTLLGSVTAGQDGSWSFTPDALTNGAHSFTTTVTDAAGNVSDASPAFDLTIAAGVPPTTSSLVVTDDTGATLVELANGASTHDNTPTLSGLAGANDAITLYNGDVVIGNTTADADGQWVFDTSTLPDGTYAFHAVATDAAGNSADSVTITVTIDTVAPEAAGDQTLVNDNGQTPVTIADGSATNDSTPTLSGTAEAGSVVTVSDNGNVIGSTTAGDDGSWNFTTPALTDGDHSLTTTVTDAAGNSSPASDPVSFTVDTQAPAAAGDITLSNNEGSAAIPVPAGTATNDPTPALSGTAEAGSTVTVTDNGNVIGSTTVGNDGSWSFTTPALGDGDHSLSTTVTDPAGNTSPASDPIGFTVDTDTPDAVSGVTVTDNVGDSQGELASGVTTDDNTPTFAGQAEAGTIVRLYDGDTLLGSATVGTDGSWSITPDALTNGAHSFTTTVTDAAGNVSAASPAFDLTIAAGVPPTTSSLVVTDDTGSTLVQLQNGAFTHDDTPTLSGLAGANNTITLYNGDVAIGNTTADADGQWVFDTSTLPDGTYAFHAVATDAAGNDADSITINITIDTLAPDAAGDLTLTNNNGATPVTIADGAPTNDSTPALSGTAEAGSVVTVSDNGNVIGSTTAGDDGSWSFTTPALTDGDHSLTTTVSDAAGNISGTSDPVTFTLDTVPPAAATNLTVTDDVGDSQGVLTAGATTDDRTLTLAGDAEANTVVQVSDGTVLLGSTTAGTDGSWTFTTDALSNGLHSLNVTVTDAAGNVSLATTPFNVTVAGDLPPATNSLEVTDDTGATLVQLGEGANTHDNTPTLSGVANPNDAITIYNGDVVIGTTTADENGQWVFATTTLPDGDYAFHALATDAAGNSADSGTINITIDTVAPDAASGVTLTNDQGGTIPAGGATNDNTPTVSGSAEPGSTVTVSDGDTVLGSTTVGDDGTWTYTTPPLNDGDHSLTTTVTDPAGNTSPATDPVAVTVDTQAPASAGNVQLSNDEGDNPQPIANGGSTNDVTPVLSGTAEPGSTVTVSDGGNVLGSTTTDSEGNWSYTTPALDEGDHSLTTTVTDPAGNTSPASVPVTVTVDTTAPAAADNVALTNDATGQPITEGQSTSDVTPVLSGTGEVGSTVTVTDGDAVLGTTTVDADGNWNFTTPTLGDGDHSLSATVTDPAGNSSAASDPISFTVDTAAPAVASEVVLINDIDTPPVQIVSGGITNDATPVLSGIGEAGTLVIVSDGVNPLGSTTVNDDGTWSFTTPILGEGEHNLSVTLVDAAGNSSPATTPITFTVDTLPPATAGELSLENDNGSSPQPIAEGGLTNDATPLFSGSAEAGSTVTVSDGDTVLGSVIAGPDGSWSFSVPALGNGDHSLSATVTDAAGNSSSATTPITFTVDATAPATATDIVLNNDNGTGLVLIADGSYTTDNTPLLSGNAEADSVVTILDGTTVLGSVVADGDGVWSFNTPILSEGNHSLSVTVTDAAGNVSTGSDAISFTVDTVAPATPADVVLNNDNGATPVAIVTGDYTNDATPVLSGSAEVGSTVYVYDGDDLLGTASVNGDGSWSYTASLADGSHSLSATVVDDAGNTSPASAPVTFVVDTVAPAAADAVLLNNDVGSTPVVINDGDITNDATPVLSGTAEIGSTVYIYDGSDTPIGSLIVADDGAWSFTLPPLGEGGHSITTVVTDAAGNSSAATAAITFTVDTIAPEAVTDLVAEDADGNPLSGATSDNVPVLNGTAEAGAIVTLYDGDNPIGSVQADATSGAWSFTVPQLADGSHTLSALATDAAGNVSPAGNAVTLNVDATAPETSDFTVTNDNVTPGVLVPNDGTTNDNTPLLSGNAEAGALVTIYDNDVEIGSVQADAITGDWSFNTNALGEGSHPLSVTVTDAVGNVSSASTVVTINVDTIAPDAVGDLVLNNNAGATLVPIADGGSTNDTTPELTGTAEAGSIVTVYSGELVLGSVSVGADGNWIFITPEGTPGTTYTLDVTVTDAAGNVSEPASVTFTIDTTAPDVAGDLALNNDLNETEVPIAVDSSTRDNTPVFSGTAEPGGIVTISDNGVVLGSTVAAAGTGEWSFTTPTLAEGDHSLTTTVTDAAGNVGPASEGYDFTVDTVAPEAISDLALSNDNVTPATGIADGALTNDNTPLLSGTTEGNGIVTVYDGDVLLGSVVANDAGVWSYNASLSEGLHTLNVTVTDAAGNVSAPASISLDVDSVAPDAVDNLTIVNNNGAAPVAIGDNTTTNDNTPLISGSAEVGSIVTIIDANLGVLGSVAVGNSGSWSFSPTLDDGTYTLTVTVTDAAGNVSDATDPFTFTVDATDPNVTTLIASDDNGATPFEIGDTGLTNDNTPLLSGATTEANAIITLYDNDVEIGSTTADAGGNWSFSPALLTDGDHVFTATVTDEIGNVSQASAPYTITVDATAPDAASELLLQNNSNATPVDIANGGLTNDSTPLFSGAAEANSLVRIYVDGVEQGSVTADSSGEWSYVFSPALTDATHTLSASVTDAAGNVSGLSSVTVTVDTIAPDQITTYTVNNNAGAVPVAILDGDSTNDSTPVLRGTTGEPGSLIQVYSDGVLVGSATVGDNNVWRVETSALLDGTHILTITATDAAGNVSTASADFTLTIDTVLPDPVDDLVVFDNAGASTGELAYGEITDDSTPTLSGTAELNSIVSIYDGSTLLGTAVTDADGNWTFTTAVLSNGRHDFTTTVTDEAGNVSGAAPNPSFAINIEADLPPATSTLQITDDSGPVPLAVADGDDTKDSTPVLTGVTATGTYVDISIDGTVVAASVTVDADGQWSYTPTTALLDGTHTISVVVIDAVGNPGETASATITVDTLAPEAVDNLLVSNNNGATPVEIANGTATNDNTPAVSGTAEAGGLVTIYDGTTVLGSTVADATSGAWTFTSPLLSNGGHSISVTVTDAAGNVSQPSATTVFLVDTIAPAPATGLTVSNNNVTPNVTVPNGGTTNDNTPAVSGQAEANSIVTIYDGTLVLGSVVASATGAWSYTTTTLGEGTHTLSARVTDAAGNVSVASSTATVVVDTVAPTGLTLNASNNDGSTPVLIANGGLTNDSTPLLSGQAEANSVVRVYDGANLLGSVVAGSTGAWSFITTTALAQGAHTLSATATDAAGNTSTAVTTTLNIDSVAPGATTLTVTDNVGAITGAVTSGTATDDNTPTLSGTAEAGSIVTIVDGSTVLGSVVADATSGAWTFTTNALSDGTHPLSVTVKDAAGNTSAATSFSLVVDTTAPVASTLTISNNNVTPNVTVTNGGTTNDNTPLLSGTAEAGSIVKIYDNGALLGSVVANATTGAWSYITSALTDGTHPLSVTVTDAAGNVSGTTSASVIIDTLAPTGLTLSASNNNGATPVLIANNGITNDSTPTLNGVAEAGSRVVITEGTTVIGSTTAGSNGQWSLVVTTALGQGAHTLSATATDAAGNTSTAVTTTFTVDTIAPAASSLTVTDDVGPNQGALANGAFTDDTTPTLSGTAEAGSLVTIYDGTTVLGSVAADATTGAWNYTTNPLSSGAHALNVTVTDAAGNTSVASTTVNITVDTTAPDASTLVLTNDNVTPNTTIAAGSSTNDSTPRLSGVAEPGTIITIYDNGNVLGSTTTNATTGAWSFNVTTALTDGFHPISVTVTDAAGNVSGTTTASVTVDTVAPTGLTLSAANNNGTTVVAIANNGVTNDSTPLLRGNGEIGAKVYVYDGTTLLGSTTVTSAGTWSFVTSTLSQGLHTLNVNQVDAAGNIGATSAVTLTVDTVAPGASTLTVYDDVGTSQGFLTSGAVTDDNRPTLAGTAEAGSIVTVYDGTTVLGSVTANATTGAWTYTTNALSEGNHTLSVKATDAAGNTGVSSTAVTITVDTIAPTASTLAITNNNVTPNVTVANGAATNDNTPLLSGSAEVGSVVTILDGTNVLGSVTVGSAGTWTFVSSALGEGTHTINVSVRDTAGNVSGTTSATIIVDTIAPVGLTAAAANNNGSTPVAIANGAVTNDSTPQLSGSGEVGAKVSVYDGTTLLGTTTVASNGTWSFVTSTLSQGTHTLVINQTDAAGNTGANVTLTLTVDTVAPNASTLTVTNNDATPNVTVPNNGATRDATPLLSGTAEAGGLVTIYDGATLLGSVVANATTGAWTYQSGTLSNGTHTLSVTVTDAAGNVGNAATSTVIVDTVAPNAPTSLVVNNAGTILTGLGEAGTTVTVRDAGGNVVGTGTVNSGGSFSVTLTTAQTTGAALAVTLTDAAGNVSNSAPATGAILISAVNDITNLNYTATTQTTQHTVTSKSASALLSVGLGDVINLSVLGNNPYLSFTVGNGETRTLAVTGSQTGISVLSTVYLEVYKLTDAATNSYTKVSATTLFSTLVSIFSVTNSGSTTVSLNGSGTYIVFLAASGVGLLTTNTVKTTSDVSTEQLSVSSTVTGNLLTNDTSSVAGTIPAGTAVTTIAGQTVGSTGVTTITTAYGTLTIDSHGNYTYVLKAGIDIATLPGADTFSYSVTDSHGAVTSATLTVDLTHSAALLSTNSLFATASVETADSDATSAHGSIYSDSSTSHTGTLSITNEHGDTTTVSSSGTTQVAGDYGTLSIAANGSYTYTLTAGLDAQTITHKEEFSYSLASTNGTITTNTFTIELHPTITGTSGNDTLTSSAYDDTITSGAGTDTLVYHLLSSADATGGNGHDTWTDFSVANGDKIDVSNLLIGWNDSTSNINDFVKVDHTSDGNTVLSIDRDGTGTAYSSTQLITLEGVNATLEELVQQPHQIHNV